MEVGLTVVVEVDAKVLVSAFDLARDRIPLLPLLPRPPAKKWRKVVRKTIEVEEVNPKMDFFFTKQTKSGQCFGISCSLQGKTCGLS